MSNDSSRGAKVSTMKDNVKEKVKGVVTKKTPAAPTSATTSQTVNPPKASTSTPAQAGKPTAASGAVVPSSIASTHSSRKSSSTQGRKTPEGRLRTAILIGINYLKVSNISTLRGCANDAILMRKFCQQLNYQNIGVLSDDVAAMQKANITNSEMPIVENIRAGRLRYLHDEPPTKGDFFLFYFAGHGNTKALPVKTTGAQGAAGPRATGFIELHEPEHPRAPVETYLAVLKEKGEAHDVTNYTEEDFRKDYLDHFASLEGVQFFVMIDSCKSGTFLDLPYRISYPGDGEIIPSANLSLSPQEEAQRKKRHDATKAAVILLSATDSEENAKEMQKGEETHGVVTRLFMEKIAPIIAPTAGNESPNPGIQLSRLIDILVENTHKDSPQTPRLSLSKNLAGNTMINFKSIRIA